MTKTLDDLVEAIRTQTPTIPPWKVREVLTALANQPDWQLVPKVATEGMLAAPVGWRASTYHTVYKAMLAHPDADPLRTLRTAKEPTNE